jgi:glutamyl/glutaminyl-tRNA synthetase
MKFSIQSINKSGAVVDIAKLDHINGKHIRQLLATNPHNLVQLLRNQLLHSYPNASTDTSMKHASKQTEQEGQNEEERRDVQERQVQAEKEKEIQIRRAVDIREDYLLYVLHASQDHFDTLAFLIQNFDYLFFEPNFSSSEATGFKDVILNLVKTKEMDLSDLGIVSL